MVGPSGEPIYDRSREHLGTTDSMCIVARRQLIRAAVAFRESGELPKNVDDPHANHVNHACGIWTLEDDWLTESAAVRSVLSDLRTFRREDGLVQLRL
jgi:phthalate 4,5-dioxygenase